MNLFELKHNSKINNILDYYKHSKDGIDFEFPTSQEFKLDELLKYADDKLGGSQQLYASYNSDANTWTHGIHIAYDKSKIPTGDILDAVMVELCQKFGVNLYRIWDGYQTVAIDDQGDLISFLDLECLLCED